MRSALGLLFVLSAALAHVGASEPTEKVWVSFDGDSVAVIRRELAELGIRIQLDRYRRGDKVAVARLERAALPELGGLFHDHFNRCGGFIIHENALAAHTVKTLLSLRLQTTAKAQRMAYTIDQADEVVALMELVDEDQILAVIQHLSSYPNRFYNSQSGVDAAVWLKDTWLGLAQNISGASVELFPHSFVQPSVILTIPGTDFPDEIIVLGAHLDSTNRNSSLAPGADDDASGVACLTEVLRCMADAGFQPRRTVKFMGYAGEEQGLLGSQDIAAAHDLQNANVVGVLQLDMTNYKGSTEDIWIIQDFTNAPQNTFVTQLINTYLPTLSVGTTRCGYGCSDHASWHNRGFPASIPFESRFGEYNPFIHSTQDTLSASGGSAQHAAKFARLAASYLVELAKGELVASAQFNARIDLPLLLAVQAAFGPCGSGPCTRDLDDDGDVDRDDLVLLFPDWASQSCLPFGDGPACQSSLAP